MIHYPTNQTRSRTRKSSGYTLIELLLYVALSGMLLTSLVYFFGTITEARVKNQTISEVNEQGAALMDQITQTIRNATAITAPATGAESTLLTLTVPTGSLSPTIFDATGAVLGYNGSGDSSDNGESNSMSATKFVASASGTVSTLYGYVGAPVSAIPNNLGSMAVYSGASSPSTLLASSANVALSPNTWTAFPISPISVTSGQTYWLAYNTNGTAGADNNLRWHAGTSGQTIHTASTFASGWPASWTGSAVSNELAVHAPIINATSAQARIKEGAGSAAPLTNDNVRVYGLSFKNLTRSGSTGAVQIRFTVARHNPQNKNEYDYQRTFTSTAEMQW
jgi:Tfp pilus assembly protein PilW